MSKTITLTLTEYEMFLDGISVLQSTDNWTRTRSSLERARAFILAAEAAGIEIPEFVFHELCMADVMLPKHDPPQHVQKRILRSIVRRAS